MQSYAFNLQNETIKRKTKDNMKEDTKRLKTDAENFEIQRNTYDYRNEIKLLS